MAGYSHTLRGFTLIELLVVVTITAVLLGLSAPSLRTIYQNWQIQKSVSAMESTLLYGRSEAVRRGGKVILQRQVDTEQSCPATNAQANWNCGWLLFFDANGDGIWGTGDTQVHQVALRAGVAVSNHLGSTTLHFDRFGLISEVRQVDTPLFNFAPKLGASSSNSRTLCMDTSGLMRSRIGTSCL